MAGTTTLIYYPGHLGSDPVTELDAVRRITWNRPVKAVPEPQATSLVSDGGFLRALRPAEAARQFGLPLATVGELVAAGRLASATFQPREGGDPEEVVVLDQATIAALRAALQTIGD
ncbi:MAG: hypothetical protein BWX64_00969 [Acidobacteria bacterium ADurb.Bin051]|nr:MAG: hypothetical protein BWX64_00969 [Acidobacteria bacterium ADurb.Bin051]